MYKTTYKIAKYISICRIKQEKVRCPILYDTSYNINHFASTPKAKILLEPIEENNYKNPHLANFDKKYPNYNDEDTEMPDVKHITPISKFSICECITFIQSRSGIQFFWSEFKSIYFNDWLKKQANRLVEDKNAMIYMKDIPVYVDNNCHPFKNNMDYA